MKLLSVSSMRATHFKYKRIGMERLGKNENAFYIMNHSSFIDLEIVAHMLFPKPFNIVTTTDAFVGKDWLLRQIGCIPTKKFVTDLGLVRDVMYAAHKLKSNIVMFPEAGYTFDGTAITIPESIGKFVKMLGIPVVIIETFGAFLRDPLYNNLQIRDVDVSATMEYVLSPEDLKEKSDKEVFEIISSKFNFDAFRRQREEGIRIEEPFRADGLERILYKCPNCKTEGRMLGSGEYIACLECGKRYRLNELGYLECEGKDECEIPHIPDWFRWEREEVRQEILEDQYSIDIPVDIVVATDTKHMFRVGEGRLTHNKDGLHLVSEEAGIDYTHKPLSSHTINCDFNFYEIGDVISFGDNKCLYYCFPKEKGISVAKVRLAAEELYKIEKAKHDEQVARRAEQRQKSPDSDAGSAT
jgi:1-acyl-sn-glycerol-3-phosphate acyltransferase